MLFDFTSQMWQHQLMQGRWKQSSLTKAVGLKHGTDFHVCDATAGLGKDGFVLAHLGYQVTLLERNPDMFRALNDALELACEPYAETLSRMDCQHADSITWLATHSPKPDITYLDPMFEEGAMKAAVKLPMQRARALVGMDEDTSVLLEAALANTKHRVVVKRAKSAPYLADRAPSHQIIGKSNRFDVYVITPFC